jgi:Lipoate synthase
MSRASRYSSLRPKERLPHWLRRPVGNASALEAVQAVVKQGALHTICEEGRCPNRAECYAAGTATFLLGGSICTRSCAFCQWRRAGRPWPSMQRSGRVADAVQRMGLRYVVLTAVAVMTSPITAPACSPPPWRRSEPAPVIAIEVLTPILGVTECRGDSQRQRLRRARATVCSHTERARCREYAARLQRSLLCAQY